MSRIKAKDTRPELVARRLIHGMGYRYRLHAKDLPGKPDIVFRPRQKVIFVNGCFWHQHQGCKDNHVPKSNISYWAPKLEKTKKRDTENQRKLISSGWQVLIIWECQLKDLETLKANVRSFLNS